MTTIYKFGSLEDGNWARHCYGNVFAREVHPEWSRVTIGADAGQVSLMLDIAKRWSGPFGVLYVLVVSRRGYEEARYQSARPCDFDDLADFAGTFREFFEQDGRHHLWFMDVPTKKQVVYDKHDLIYSYGDDDAVISLLERKGFVAGDPRIPFPHQHSYNREHDDYEDKVMTYFEWIEFPLQEELDNP